MGFFDSVLKGAEKLGDYMASDKMQDKMLDGYMKGKISDETMKKYEDALIAHDRYKNNKRNGNR